MANGVEARARELYREYLALKTQLAQANELAEARGVSWQAALDSLEKAEAKLAAVVEVAKQMRDNLPDPSILPASEVPGAYGRAWLKRFEDALKEGEVKIAREEDPIVPELRAKLKKYEDRLLAVSLAVLESAACPLKDKIIKALKEGE